MDTIFNPLVGGVLIGLTATIYLLSIGKVIGISGILSQLLFSKERFLPFLFIAEHNPHRFNCCASRLRSYRRISNSHK